MKHCECLRRHLPTTFRNFPDFNEEPVGFYAVTVAPLVVELHRGDCGLPYIEKILGDV